MVLRLCPLRAGVTGIDFPTQPEEVTATNQENSDMSESLWKKGNLVCLSFLRNSTHYASFSQSCEKNTQIKDSKEIKIRGD